MRVIPQPEPSSIAVRSRAAALQSYGQRRRDDMRKHACARQTWRLSDFTVQGTYFHNAAQGAHRVPLVGHLGERGGARRHEHLPDAVLKRLQRLIVHAQERLPRRAHPESALWVDTRHLHAAKAPQVPDSREITKICDEDSKDHLHQRRRAQWTRVFDSTTQV